MKRPLQLSLAITLALCGTNALALGLGPARVYSKLNQPLNAEIPIIQGSAGEAEGLLVNLASAEDFERIGLSRSRLRVPLEFAIGKDSQGATVIKVTSTEPVRETYLDFLVEANWPKGRLLREYTMLLDPPLTAPSRATAATAAPAAAPARSSTEPVPPRETASAPVSPRVARSAPRPAPAARANDGEYGPVAAGDTLSEIARANAAGANINQMMLALLKNNPEAFYKNNINALKRGAILRIPDAEDLRAMGSAQAAAAAVQAQIEDWRGGSASPARIADAPSGDAAAVPESGSKAARASASRIRADDERLQLVPPKAGKDSMAMADRPGAGAGSAAANASSELKSELARTRESLTATQQESSELKSRVQALEEIKDKNDRLLSLKDSEIAELQQKLRQLQSAPASAPAAAAEVKVDPAPDAEAEAKPDAQPAAADSAPATAAAAVAEEPIDKSDIWGQPGTAGADAGTPIEAAAPAPATVVTPDAGSESAASPATMPSPADSESTAAAASSAASVDTETAADRPAAQVTPLAEAPKAAPATPMAKPTVVPQSAASTRLAAEPWYAASWVKPAALGAGALLLLLGLFGLRSRKVVPAARGSIADSFGDSPLGGAAASGSLDSEERSLLAQLQDEPDNVGLHLELLSVYYANRDVEKFEQAAALMHAHVHDPDQAEWIEAQAMGQQIAPHNPLFASAEHYDDADVDHSSAHADGDVGDEFESAPLADDAGYAPYDETPAHHDFAVAVQDDAALPPPHDAALDEAPVGEPAHDFQHTGTDLGFGIESTSLADLPAVPPPATSADEFGYELPPLDFDADSVAQAATDMDTLQPPALDLDLDEDYFSGGDATATKLDLAKAYMDMGDPEGARSMLEEVLAEGSDEQQAEAHRLIAELG